MIIRVTGTILLDDLSTPILAILSILDLGLFCKNKCTQISTLVYVSKDGSRLGKSTNLGIHEASLFSATLVGCDAWLVCGWFSLVVVCFRW